MSMIPTLQEIEDTVTRMEERYAALRDPTVKTLMAHYREVASRFERELSDRRDSALSKGAALMLIQSVAHAPRAKSSD
jgi:hypothetical protein